MNLRAQEWKRWKSNWPRYKRYARLTNQGNCVYNRWACFSCELKVAAGDDGLADDDNLDEEQLLKQVMRLTMKSTKPWCLKSSFFSKGRTGGSMRSPT